MHHTHGSGKMRELPDGIRSVVGPWVVWFGHTFASLIQASGILRLPTKPRTVQSLSSGAHLFNRFLIAAFRL